MSVPSKLDLEMVRELRTIAEHIFDDEDVIASLNEQLIPVYRVGHTLTVLGLGPLQGFPYHCLGGFPIKLRLLIVTDRRRIIYKVLFPLC